VWWARVCPAYRPPAAAHDTVDTVAAHPPIGALPRDAKFLGDVRSRKHAEHSFSGLII
jgi:hypothetical protein